MSQSLPTVVLGRSGLKVTRLGFGAMELRDAPRGRPVSDDQAKAVLNAVLDGGINFIDTSIDYGNSEGFIGKHISHRRSEFYLATKCGCSVTPEAVKLGGHVFTRENIVAGVNQSLGRMKTDYLDFVQFHQSPSKETLEEHEAVETLRDLQKEGKIRFLGSSSTLPNIEDHIEMEVFDEFQIPYSGLERGHEEMVTRAAEAGAGTVIRGAVSKGEPGGSNVRRLDDWKRYDEANLEELREEGESRTAFILRYTLSHPGVHTMIVGTQNIEHLLDNVNTASKGPLAPNVYEEAKRRLDTASGKPTSI